MDLGAYLPFWTSLTPAQQEKLAKAAVLRHGTKGQMIHGTGEQCLGLLVIRSGQLRAFILSEEGRDAAHCP